MIHYSKIEGTNPPAIPEHEPFPDDEPEIIPEKQPTPTREIPSPEPGPSVPDPDGIPVLNMGSINDAFEKNV